MNSKDLLKDFKARLLNSGKNTSIFYDKFKKNSTSINLIKLEQYNLLRRGRNDKNPISLKQAMQYEEFFISFMDINQSDKNYNDAFNFLYEINKILKKFKESYEETNLHTLYMGRYYIEGSLNEKVDKDYFRCPLILQSVSLENVTPKIFKVSINEDKILNNPLFNIIATANKKPYEFLELDEEKIKNFDSLKKYLTNLLTNIGYKFNNIDTYLNGFEDQYDSYVALRTKADEAERFFEKKINVFDNVYALNLCSIGIYNIASSSILSAYKQLEELDDEFLYELLSEKGDSIGLKKDEFIENDIKTISILDYSQKSAINSALKQSIYLFGPPGTGKSQTIVNLIANIIDRNETSLFITEKKVASDVVYNKLEELNDFVLMIHNNEKVSTIYNKLKIFVTKIEDFYNDPEKYKNIYNYYLENEKSKDIDDIFDKINTYKKIMNSEKGKTYQKFQWISSNYDGKIYSINNDTFDFLQIWSNIFTDNKYIVESYIFFIDYLGLKSLTNDQLNALYESEVKSNAFLFNRLSLNKSKTKVGLFNKKKFNSFLLSEKFAEAKEILKEFIEKFNISFIDKVRKIVDMCLANGFENLENINLKSITTAWCNIFYVKNKKIIDFMGTEWAIEIGKISKEKVKNNRELIYIKHLNYVYDILIDETKGYTNTVGEKISFKKAYFDLKIQMQKIRGNMKMKTMFSRYRQLLRLFFPIFIGSPETISDHKILPIRKNNFTYAIFDEASQIFTEKCIPSLYRAKKYVISGDDKQLAPSNWFNMSRDINYFDSYDIQENEEITLSPDNIDIKAALEFESLIDFAKGKYQTNKLKYHYRSNYKELIDFSNSRYYDNELVISSQSSQKLNPIIVIDVNGTRVSGVVSKEADTVAKILVDMIKNPLYANKTFGIITSNAEQQKHITDLLEKLCNSNEDLYRHIYTNEAQKKLFVKNIENVQGDERDIIIFALGYAKDSSGKYRQNYGPLAQDNGERRLNVAITRSKDQMIIIKSINSSDINSLKRGVKDLKDFLKYCELIQSPIENKETIKLLLSTDTLQYGLNGRLREKTFDSDFEEEVYSEIKKLLPSKDFELHTQVNASGFKIDQAIFDSVHRKYILAIECDGAAYHSSPFHKQNDYERQSYLENKGWTFKRILSTHWWNKDSYIKKQFLNSIKVKIENYIREGE